MSTSVKDMRILPTESSAPRAWLPVGLALAMTLGMLAYQAWVFLPTMADLNQQAGYTQGNLSDLYLRWYPTREFLLHGRDPYAAALSAEMQQGFFGRAAQPGETLPAAPVFAHPLYTVFFLAPFALLDFDLVQTLAAWLFPLLLALGGVWWARVLRGRWDWFACAVGGLLALAAPPTLEVSRTQSPSALVFFVLAAGILLVARRQYVPAGALLAVSTIRPQESWPVIALLLAWTLGEWRARRSLALSFTITLAVLLLTSELALPGWLFEFIPQLLQYDANWAGLHLFVRFVPSGVLVVLTVGWLILLAAVSRSIRHEPPESPRLAVALALGLAVGQVILPTLLNYEGIFLLPALLALLWGRAAYRGSAFLRILHSLTLIMLLLPWISALALLIPGMSSALQSGLQLERLTPASALNTVRFLPWQFYPVLPPLAALALVVLVRQGKSSALGSQSAAIRNISPPEPAVQQQ